MKRSSHVVQTKLVCGCGEVFTIFRKKGRQRRDGHIKHLWCIRCKARTAHTEDNSQEAFYLDQA